MKDEKDSWIGAAAAAMWIVWHLVILSSIAVTTGSFVRIADALEIIARHYGN